MRTELQDPFFKQAEIPELKKKEEERKGAGAVYVGAPRVSNLLTAGNGVARIGSQSLLGRAALALSRMLGGESTWLGAFFMTQAGRAALLAFAVLCSGALAAAVLGRASFQEQAPAVMLAGVGSSGIVIDAPRDRSLSYLAKANVGELEWDEKKAPAVQEAPSEKAQEPAPQAEIPPFKMPDVQQLAKAGLDRGAFLKKLDGAGGRWNMGNGLGLRDALAGSRASLGAVGSRAAVKPLQRPKPRPGARSLSTLRGRSNRAMGQLKLARNMSRMGSAAYGDARAKQYGTDAFEQGRTIGGTPIGDGVIVPPGWTDPEPEPNPEPPIVNPPGPVDPPYQPPIDHARQSGNDAAMLKVLGMILLAIGGVLVAIGAKLMSNPFTAGIGAALLAVGIALIAAGIACLAMSQAKAGAAKNDGKTVEQEHGQDDQGRVVDECAAQAAEGTPIDQCTPSLGPDYFRQKLTNTVHEDVERERGAAYTLD